MHDATKPIEVRVDPDMLEIIPTYLNSMRRAEKNMRQALKSGDYDTIMRKGHQMKGEGSAFGFDEISVIGKRLQHAAGEKDSDSLSKDLAKFGDYLARVVVRGV